MKKSAIARTSTLAAVMAAVVAFASTGNAQQSIDDAFSEPRVMLYASKRFGNNREVRYAPTFGLRLEQAVNVRQRNWFADPSQMNFMPMLDFRMYRGHGTQLLFSNIPMLDSGSISVGSSTEESWRNPWFWGGMAVAALAVACVTETGICEDDDDDTYTPPPEITPGE
ncbi:MAG: hypothetical protein AAGH76_16220 [Pseudomonadota bacterium]